MTDDIVKCKAAFFKFLYFDRSPLDNFIFSSLYQYFLIKEISHFNVPNTPALVTCIKNTKSVCFISQERSLITWWPMAG